MQTILGSSGAIGFELAKALKEYTNEIRLVSRNPEKVNESDELVAADLLNPSELNKAVNGSTIVYVTIGFAYNLKVWQESWPTFISNVIDACIEHNCKLVFFDNMYMYDPGYLDGMDEETPINPPSKKGKVRAEIASLIMKQVEEAKLKALIVRSADFYGPGIKNNSMLTETVFKPLSKSKAANWMASLNFKHSFTYTPDAGKATALLGNSEKAYNQVWHLPTAANPYTGREWIETIAKEMGVKPKFQLVNRWLLKLLGIFMPFMREMPEMMYQYNRDYVFSSDKFNKHFDFRATPYIQGIREIIKLDYKK